MGVALEKKGAEEGAREGEWLRGLVCSVLCVEVLL
jgi:hypothetical protein